FEALLLRSAEDEQDESKSDVAYDLEHMNHENPPGAKLVTYERIAEILGVSAGHARKIIKDLKKHVKPEKINGRGVLGFKWSDVRNYLINNFERYKRLPEDPDDAPV